MSLIAKQNKGITSHQLFADGIQFLHIHHFDCSRTQLDTVDFQALFFGGFEELDRILCAVIEVAAAGQIARNGNVDCGVAGLDTAEDIFNAGHTQLVFNAVQKCGGGNFTSEMDDFSAGTQHFHQRIIDAHRRIIVFESVGNFFCHFP